MRRRGIMMRKKSASTAQEIADLFETRVLADSGVMESKSCLVNVIQDLKNRDFYTKFSWLTTANAYKTSKIYSLKPGSSGDLTFSRSGTRFRNTLTAAESLASNIVALDYSEKTCPTINLEPVVTNSILQSQTLATTWGVVRATVSSNATTAPDGTVTAEKLLEQASTGQHNVNQSITKAASSLPYHASCYFKASERAWARIQCGDVAGTNGARGWFDLTNGVKGASESFGAGFTLYDYHIISVGSGWYQCVISFTSDTGTALQIILGAQTANSEISYSGVLNSGLFMWGAKLAAGLFYYSYIPTTTVAVTKPTDGPATLTSVSSLLGQTAGLLYFEISSKKDSISKQISISDASTANSVALEFTTGNVISAYINSGSVLQATVSSATSFVDNFLYKIAIVYRANYLALFVDGFKIGEITSLTLPTSLTKISYDDGAGNNKFYGDIKVIGGCIGTFTDGQASALTSPVIDPAVSNLLYIFDGDSYLDGAPTYNQITDYPAAYQGVFPNVKMWTGSQFDTLDTSANNNQFPVAQRTGSATYSMIFGILKSQQAVGKTIYIVPYAIAGSQLETKVGGDWNYNSVGEYLDLSITELGQAMTWMQSNAPSYQIVALNISLGVNDATNGTYATISQNLQGMVAKIRLTASAVPVVINYVPPTNATITNKAAARLQCLDAVANITGATSLNIDTAALAADSVHPSPTGHISIANQLIRLI